MRVDRIDTAQPEGRWSWRPAHRAVFKDAILDPMGRADMKRSMVEGWS